MCAPSAKERLLTRGFVCVSVIAEVEPPLLFLHDHGLASASLPVSVTLFPRSLPTCEFRPSELRKQNKKKNAHGAKVNEFQTDAHSFPFLVRISGM